VSPALYLRCVSLARDWVREPCPEAVRTFDLNTVRLSCGIYVHCDPARSILYVGQVHRVGDGSAITRRLEEHRRTSPGRVRLWHWSYLIPLHEDIDIRTTKAIEGRIIRLLNPIQNVHRPRDLYVPWRQSLVLA
jgi:hypothetical protein